MIKGKIILHYGFFPGHKERAYVKALSLCLKD